MNGVACCLCVCVCFVTHVVSVCFVAGAKEIRSKWRRIAIKKQGLLYVQAQALSVFVFLFVCARCSCCSLVFICFGVPEL